MTAMPFFNPSWQLTDVPSLKFPDLNTAGASVSKPEYAPVKWGQAVVPGTILVCLVANHTLESKAQFGRV